MNGNKHALRAAVLAAGAAILALVPAGTASAAGGHTSTDTENFHGTQTDSLVNPCNGNTVDVTNETNLVFHVTSFSDSDELWFTFTEEDKTSGVDTVSGVTYAGHNTAWGNENDNERNSNSTFTNSFRVVGSDGSVITGHEVTHVTVLPSGDVSVSFDKLSLTCD
jgi:hypothetical protein